MSEGDPSGAAQPNRCGAIIWCVGMAFFGAAVGAVTCCGGLVWSIQGMGAAGGGDGLDGIEIAIPLSLAVGGVGGAVCGWIAGLFRYRADANRNGI